MSPDYYCNVCDIADYVLHDDNEICLKQHQNWLMDSEAEVDKLRAEIAEWKAKYVDLHIAHGVIEQSLKRARRYENCECAYERPQVVADDE